MAAALYQKRMAVAEGHLEPTSALSTPSKDSLVADDDQISVTSDSQLSDNGTGDFDGSADYLDSDEKRYKCPFAGCNKRYKNSNGLSGLSLLCSVYDICMCILSHYLIHCFYLF